MLIEDDPWDYIIGSVHFIADRAVDHDGYDIWLTSSPDEVWSAYFEALGDAAASGLFDVLAHPDLVKVWGKAKPDPTASQRDYYELAMEQIAAADVAIEVSTAGLRKPVGEIYPARELLEMCVQAGKPVSLSSDAHEPEFIGHGYDRAVELMRDVGIDHVRVFERRERRHGGARMSGSGIGYDVAPVRRRAAAGAGRGRGRGREQASWVIRTPTSSRTR